MLSKNRRRMLHIHWAFIFFYLGFTKSFEERVGLRTETEKKRNNRSVASKKKKRKVKWKDQSRSVHSRAKPMICDSLQRASVTGMALQGSMKSLLIVQSGNWSSQLLAMTDLFTFQRLDPSRKKIRRREAGASIFCSSDDVPPLIYCFMMMT